MCPLRWIIHRDRPPSSGRYVVETLTCSHTHVSEPHMISLGAEKRRCDPCIQEYAATLRPI